MKKMINNLIGLGTILLGATMAKKAGAKFFISDDDLVDGYSGKIDDVMFDFIREYESFSANAYYLQGEATWTIGYGSTRWLKPNGSVIRTVIKGDVITEPNARLQTQYYFNGIKPHLDNFMIKNNYRFTNRAYQMLLQFLYGTGLGALYGVKNSKGVNDNRHIPFISMLSEITESTDNNYNAEMMKNAFVRYYKQFSGQYGRYGLGWSRRLYALYMFVKGTPISKTLSDKTIIKAY
ncbi:glycoside hydrolase family protein [Elizabethkingia meningoseptica]|uniref:glycoside hydrolase family protein n=1 Tax=Elizabethkingia meningoseptica TaxID=238 RepID=UPI003158F6F5